MTRSITFSIGEFYHIYNRGTEKRKIFLSNKDYTRFIALLYLCNSKDPIPLNIWRKPFEEILETDRNYNLVDIGAYCIMPNHFHLLLHERTENGISLFMQKLTTAYTMYFNKKYIRSGNLFQGVFKAEHASNDEYLEYLFTYIHLNPVKLIEPKWREVGIKNTTKAENFLKKYTYSSYLEYVGVDRKEKVILTSKAFPGYFDTIIDFKKIVKFWLEFNSIIK